MKWRFLGGKKDIFYYIMVLVKSMNICKRTQLHMTWSIVRYSTTITCRRTTKIKIKDGETPLIEFISFLPAVFIHSRSSGMTVFLFGGDRMKIIAVRLFALTPFIASLATLVLTIQAIIYPVLVYDIFFYLYFTIFFASLGFHVWGELSEGEKIR